MPIVSRTFWLCAQARLAPLQDIAAAVWSASEKAVEPTRSSSSLSASFGALSRVTSRAPEAVSTMALIVYSSPPATNLFCGRTPGFEQ